VKITTAAEMSAIDHATTVQHGISSLTLMGNAGSAVADFAIEHWPSANRITVICGRGNNGGDGFVAARRLHAAGKVVEVLLLGPTEGLRPDAAAMLARLPLRPTLLLTTEEVVRESFRSLAESDLIIDAIFGTGYQRRAETTPASQLADAAIAAINSSAAPVLSVDLPSGTDADAAASTLPAGVCRSSAIVTFTAPKPAHVFAPLTTGPIVVAPIGSPTEAIVSAQNLHAITPQDVAALFAPRLTNSNKGHFGHVLVVAGSLGKAGAAAMSAMSALRIGAGLVTVATPAAVLPTVAGFAPELMTEPLGHHESNFVSASDVTHCLEIAKSRTVLAVGPGLSQHAGVADFVRRLVKGAHQPIVLDADGLNAFVGSLKDLAGQPVPLVLTPHPGEMARLLGVTVAQVQSDRISSARDFAHRLRCILVLKGSRTIVALPSGELWVACTGNPGLATGGTGDILTGMIAGAIAQFPQRIEEAVRAAVYLHGLAGDVAAARLGQESLVATDLLRSLPSAFRMMRRRAARRTIQLC